MTKSIIVSGAGHASANGTYLYIGTHESKPAYAKSLALLFWDGEIWLINDAAFGNLPYGGEEDVATPDLVSEWVIYDGTEPAPTVIEGEEPAGGGGGLMVHAGMVGGING